MPRKKRADTGHMMPMHRGDYPQKVASENIRALMHEQEAEPHKFPGGRKQVIAIGINKARRGKRMRG